MRESSAFSSRLTGHRVCSEHFVHGIKTYLDNIPTVFPWNKAAKKNTKRILIEKQLPVNTTDSTTVELEKYTPKP